MAYTVHYYNWSPYSAHFYQIPDHCAESNKVVSNGTLCVIYSTNIKSAENIGEDPYKQTFAVGMSGNTILTLDYEFSGAANGVFDKVIVLSIYYDGKKMWYTD
ncbi:MAG: hypothetical protein NTX61_03105 [Bacteroidetes bacterium]|nr:hypothetical protein [Bacteroidota bacterium]